VRAGSGAEGWGLGAMLCGWLSSLRQQAGGALGSCGQRSLEAPNRFSHEPKSLCASRQLAPTKPTVPVVAVDHTNPWSCFIQSSGGGWFRAGLAVDFLIFRSAESAIVAAQQRRVY
jgi:hypothetical protein